MTTRFRWQDLLEELLDADNRPVLRELGERVAMNALRELRQTGAMLGFFFRRPMGLPHEIPDDPSTWGPGPNEIDWTGFPG